MSAKVEGQTLPEAMCYAIGCWAGVLVAQLIHLVLNVVMLVMDPSVLRSAAAKRISESSETVGAVATDQALVSFSVYGALAITTMLQLIIIAILAWGLRVLSQPGHRHAAPARRLWSIFSFYFGFIAFTVFGLSRAGAAIPDWLFLLDGSVQIVAGLLAVLGLVFSLRVDTLSSRSSEENSDTKRR